MSIDDKGTIATVKVADAKTVRERRTQRKQSERTKKASMQLDYLRIIDVFKEFQEMSPIFKETGAVHSAGLLDSDYNVLCFYEDMGRHNTVDKVIGKALIDNLPLADSMLITSSRMPVELVAKAGIAHIPVILSISAPTLQSINYAKANNITLIGMFRNNRINIYNYVGNF
jgi:FdhD protein